MVGLFQQKRGCYIKHLVEAETQIEAQKNEKQEKNEEGFEKEKPPMKEAFIRLFAPKILEEENVSVSGSLI